MNRSGIGRLACGLAAGVAGAVGGYLAWVRPWGLRWGATDEECARAMPGDDFLAAANYETTKAIAVDASADAVWPWLAQLGRGRGGLYSYDALDRLFGILDRPSARTVLPQYQELRTGDRIPMAGSDWPVVLAEPNRFLVLGDHFDESGAGWSWTFGLYATPAGGTRLVSRSRAQVPGSPAWRLALVVIDAAALVMTRRMLLNLRERAEALHAARR